MFKKTFPQVQTVSSFLLSIKIENASTDKKCMYPLRLSSPTAGNIYVYEILSRYMDSDVPCIHICNSKELGTTNTSINESDYTILAYPTKCSMELDN